MARIDPKQRKTDYTIRILSALVASLALMLCAVKWWPPTAEDDDDRVYSARGQEVIEIDEIVQTSQAAAKPPPPVPLPPIVRPDDELIVEDLVFDNNMLELQNMTDDALSTPGPIRTASGQIPAESAKPVRIVQPEYTRDARRKKIRAEVIVEVLVDKRGQVQNARVIQRYLLGKDAEKEVVDLLGYGLEESAIAAASQYMFRPAREDGKAVQSYTTLTFSFGV